MFDPLSCAMHGCDTAELMQSGDGGQSWATADGGSTSRRGALFPLGRDT